MDIRFLNYHSVYSMQVEGKKKPTFVRNTAICFAELFNALSTYRGHCPKIEYKLILFKDKKSLNRHRNNYCPFTKRIIINHLKQAQHLLPEFSSFIIDSVEIDEIPAYEITMTVEAAPTLVHKYVLTWTRFLYECCFNIMLLDALRLSKIDKFKFISIANLLNIVATCYNRANFPDFNTWHGIGMGRCEKFLTSKELYAKLLVTVNLNSLYDQRNLAVPIIPKCEKAGTLEFWESDEDFLASRLPIYLEALNTLKAGYPYCH